MIWQSLDFNNWADGGTIGLPNGWSVGGVFGVVYGVVLGQHPTTLKPR